MWGESSHTGIQDMRTIDTKQIENCVYRLAGRAGLTLTDSCRAALNSAKEGGGVCPLRPS